jgi:hypothetical protein
MPEHSERKIDLQLQKVQEGIADVHKLRDEHPEQVSDLDWRLVQDIERYIREYVTQATGQHRCPGCGDQEAEL